MRSFEAQLTETRGFFREYDVPAGLAKRVGGLQMLKVSAGAPIVLGDGRSAGPGGGLGVLLGPLEINMI